MLHSALNNKLVASLLGLVLFVYHGHAILGACAHDLLLQWLPSCNYNAILSIYISLGNAVTSLRSGAIFNESFIANYLDYVPVKEFLQLVNMC